MTNRRPLLCHMTKYWLIRDSFDVVGLNSLHWQISFALFIEVSLWAQLTPNYIFEKFKINGGWWCFSSIILGQVILCYIAAGLGHYKPLQLSAKKIKLPPNINLFQRKQPAIFLWLYSNYWSKEKERLFFVVR